MLRGGGIAYKLTLILAPLGIVPMVVLGVLAYGIARDSMVESSIQLFVQRVAEDTAENLDYLIRGRGEAVDLLADSGSLRDNVAELLETAPGGVEHERALNAVRSDLDRWIEIVGTADLVAVVGLDGRIIVTNEVARRTRTGRFAEVPPGRTAVLWSDDFLAGASLADRFWWPEASGGRPIFVDQHVEPLVLESYGYPRFLDDRADLADRERAKNPESYSFAVARPLHLPGVHAEDRTGAAQAILVVWSNWTAVQDMLDAVNREFARHPRYSSGYTFLFGDDLDTIIGHHFLELYERKLVADHGLGDFQAAMRDAPQGVGAFRYVYQKQKISGFAPVDATGWRVGFGINEDDFLLEVRRLRTLIVALCAAAGLVIVVLVLVLARRFARPINKLIEQTGEIARGNLDARVDIETGDEIAALGRSFNTMAADLAASNTLLIEAEKKAAWQEMARQIAHEIKNPLTPMKLSAQLIRRARDDRHPEFDRILDEGLASIVAQIESLRRIAAEFADFAAMPRTAPRPVRPIELVERCIELYGGRENTDVRIVLEAEADPALEVLVDPAELERVLLNLFNNAFEAMENRGNLRIVVRELDGPEGPSVRIRVQDDGRGIPADILPRLFEPYFTTRSSGTGLGLAICKKTIEGYGGTIGIESEEGRGTSVVITLPVHCPD